MRTTATVTYKYSREYSVLELSTLNFFQGRTSLPLVDLPSYSISFPLVPVA